MRRILVMVFRPSMGVDQLDYQPGIRTRRCCIMDVDSVAEKRPFCFECGGAVENIIDGSFLLTLSRSFCLTRCLRLFILHPN